MVLCNSIIVAIPIRNEAAMIQACLQGLIEQTHTPDLILLLLNNCTDGTLDTSLQMQRTAPNIRIESYDLHGERASAGEARRLALNHAVELAGNGLILTTDADAAPDRNWIAENLAAINAGADVVCGTAEIDDADALNLPHRLKSDDAHEKLLLKSLDEITSLVDPEHADPWPRHQQNSGASIAVKASFLRKLGGAPHVATGEDRALIREMQLIDARIRHTPRIKVKVSGRLDGRANGGMAETIKRRIEKPDELLDETIEPVVDAYRRALAKSRLREIRDGQVCGDRLANDLLIRRETLRRALVSPYFGTAWAEVECKSPVLHRRRVPFVYQAQETRQAVALIRQLKAGIVKTDHSWANVPAHLASPGASIAS
jgi:Glycosyl transferase family 2